jgi:hypothetical protein
MLLFSQVWPCYASTRKCEQLCRGDFCLGALQNRGHFMILVLANLWVDLHCLDRIEHVVAVGSGPRFKGWKAEKARL